jgi:hypothetical protein
MPFVKEMQLYEPLVVPGSIFKRLERAKMTPFAGLCVPFARKKAIFAGL